jgi:hypothetical protein
VHVAKKGLQSSLSEPHTGGTKLNNHITHDIWNDLNSHKLQHTFVHLIILRGGPLEIPGGGGENSPKKIRAKKNAWKKIRAAITSEKKNSCKQTSKYKKIRAEVKCIKKKSCRDMRLKKKFVPQIFYIPIPPPFRGF